MSMSKKMLSSVIARANKNAAKSAEERKQSKKRYFEAKKAKIEMAKRHRQLRELAHDTFVSLVPDSRSTKAYAWEIFQASKPAIKRLAAEGGTAYDEALLALKFTWRSVEDFQRSVKVLS